MWQNLKSVLSFLVDWQAYPNHLTLQESGSVARNCLSFPDKNCL